MDKRYKKYGQKAVFTDTSRNGLLVNFNREYKEKFGKNINISCLKCRQEAWDNYLKLFEMSKSGNYKLKGIYNGIQISFGGKPLRNGEFTDKEAKELIKTHPLGEGLFEVLPKEEPKKAPKKRVAKKKTDK